MSDESTGTLPDAASPAERFVSEVVRDIFKQEISDEKVREVARKVEKAIAWPTLTKRKGKTHAQRKAERIALIVPDRRQLT